MKKVLYYIIGQIVLLFSLVNSEGMETSEKPSDLQGVAIKVTAVDTHEPGMAHKKETTLHTLATTTSSVVRKSVRNLSDKEKDDYIRGVELLRANGKYMSNYVEIHANQSYIRNAHFGPAFLPWHREFILRLEKDLQSVLNDPNFALPYWDWEWDAAQTDPKNAPVWHPDFMGGEGTPVNTGPFEYPEWLTNNSQGLNRRFGAAVRASSLPTTQDISDALSIAEYDKSPWDRTSSGGFRNTLEGFYNGPRLHNRVHAWVGGHMSEIPTAVYDPVFFLHHCNIDRIWAMWQNLHPSATYPASGPMDGHKLHDAMAPWNTPADTRTPADVLDYKPLGYKYQDDQLLITYREYSSTRSRIVQITSTDGMKWSNEVTYDSDINLSSPALAIFNKKLYRMCVRTTAHGNNHLISHTSLDGTTWEEPNQIMQTLNPSYIPTGSCALASFKDDLYCVYSHPLSFSSSQLLFTRTRDGKVWDEPKLLGNPVIGLLDSSPSLVDTGDKLCCMFVDRGAPSKPNEFYITYTAKGKKWDTYKPTHIKTKTGPSLISYSGYFYCAHQNPQDNNLWIASSSNGDTWEDDRVDNIQIQGTPSLTRIKRQLYCTYIGRDNYIKYTVAGEQGGWDNEHIVGSYRTSDIPVVMYFPNTY